MALYRKLHDMVKKSFRTAVIVAAGSSTRLGKDKLMLPIGGIGAIVTPYLVGAVAEQAGIEAGMACPMVAILLSFLCALLLRKMPD